MSSGFDPEILQDFLTESGELLDQLEGDLVLLEQTPQDPELLNKVFRALHTIKGSASFLALTNLVRIAHASEGALNAARNGVVRVDRSVMDLLLQAVDILKTQMEQVRQGEDLVEAPAELVEQLTAIGEGRSPKSAVAAAKQSSTRANASGASAPPVASAPASEASASGLPGVPGVPGVRKLELPPGKSDLLEFLVADVEDTLSKIEAQVSTLAASASPAEGVGQLGELADSLFKAVEFFDFAPMCGLARALSKAADEMSHMASDLAPQAVPRVQAIAALLADQTQGLKKGELREHPTETLLARLAGVLSNAALTPDATIAPGSSVEDVLRLDGVRAWASQSNASEANAAAAMRTEAPASVSAGVLAAASEPAHPSPTTGEAKKASAQGGAGSHGAQGDNTIRVEVSRLETLMNLVGELVLQKNRISALSRRVASQFAGGEGAELLEQLTLSAGGLDRATSDIQMAVMRTRMQPLDKLFGKYPRLIRDLAGKTGKKIRLAIEGGETEVDKSVIEELGDPLVHLIRNSADHGLEGPEERVKAGKGDEGTITLRASHEGSHVRLLIIDDGRGLSRERIGKKAVERGMCTPEQLAAMPDREVFNYIFAAGFSTAEKVSDLSGRGVGMDVVRTNIEKVKGTIELSSEAGKGTTIAILIPLTVAILPAMLVAVEEEIYAIPLGNIIEIVKPLPEQVTTIGEHPVMRLRNSVLPLISAVDAFRQPYEGERPTTPFAVVIQMNERRIGLMVSRLIGQQEIVIKPLDGVVNHRGGAVSGATVRDDGGVSLIADIPELMKLAETMAVKAA